MTDIPHRMNNPLHGLSFGQLLSKSISTAVPFILKQMFASRTSKCAQPMLCNSVIAWHTDGISWASSFRAVEDVSARQYSDILYMSNFGKP